MIAQYRLDNLRALLADEAVKELDISNLDAQIATLLDSDNVEQHHGAITQNIMNAFLGLQDDHPNE